MKNQNDNVTYMVTNKERESGILERFTFSIAYSIFFIALFTIIALIVPFIALYTLIKSMFDKEEFEEYREFIKSLIESPH